jgi:FKBP-type peptidyl-prolyl cis-trans isomerase (trigger factor)
MRSRAALDAARGIETVRENARGEYRDRVKTGIGAALDERGLEMDEARNAQMMELIKQMFPDAPVAETEEEKKKEQGDARIRSEQEKEAADDILRSVGRNPDWSTKELNAAKTAYAQWSKTNPGVPFNDYVRNVLDQRRQQGKTMDSGGVLGMGEYTWPT